MCGEAEHRGLVLGPTRPGSYLFLQILNWEGTDLIYIFLSSTKDTLVDFTERGRARGREILISGLSHAP